MKIKTPAVRTLFLIFKSPFKGLMYI